MAKWRITVDREDFVDALTRATKGVRKGSKFELRLEMSKDGLVVSGLGITVSLPASGDWPGAVMLSGETARKLAGVLPNSVPFVIEIDGQTMKFGSFSIGVKALDIAPTRVDFVIGAKSRDIVLSIARNGEPKVRASAGAAMVERAKLDLSNATAKAFRALEEFGVSRDELEAFVEECIARQIGRKK